MIVKKLNNIIWNLSAKSDKKRVEKETFVHEGIIVKKDISYSNHGQRSLLDIYFPKNHNKKLPIIINVPGGGYTVGEKENNRLQSELFAKQGFCVLTINYRRINEKSFPAPVEDLFDVFNFVKNKLKASIFDTENVFLMGDSAGAHIAALAGVMANNQLMQYDFGVFSNLKIRACAFFSSSFQIVNLPLVKNKYKKTIYGNKINFDKVTNVKKVINKSFPPNIVVSPINDFLIFQSLAFNKKCKSEGVENQFVLLKKGKKLGHNSMIKNATHPIYTNMYRQVFEFFKERIKTQTKAQTKPQNNKQKTVEGFQSKQPLHFEKAKDKASGAIKQTISINTNKKRTKSKNNQEREM